MLGRSDNKLPEHQADYLQARGLRAASIPTKAKLTYFQDKSLTLQLQYKKEDEWSTCFNLEPSTSMPLKLPNVVYLGFSAETGELSDNFDIISVESRNMYSSGKSSGGAGSKQESSSRSKAGKVQKKKSSGGGWGWFFIKMILFAGVIVGGYVGWTMYRANKRTRF
jgi:lectin, mannose-binding 2